MPTTCRSLADYQTVSVGECDGMKGRRERTLYFPNATPQYVAMSFIVWLLIADSEA